MGFCWEWLMIHHHEIPRLGSIHHVQPGGTLEHQGTGNTPEERVHGDMQICKVLNEMWIPWRCHTWLWPTVTKTWGSILNQWVRRGWHRLEMADDFKIRFWDCRWNNSTWEALEISGISSTISVKGLRYTRAHKGRGFSVDMDLCQNKNDHLEVGMTSVFKIAMDTETVLSTCNDNLCLDTCLLHYTPWLFFTQNIAHLSFFIPHIIIWLWVNTRCTKLWQTCALQQGGLCSMLAWPTPTFMCACECGHACAFLYMSTQDQNYIDHLINALSHKMSQITINYSRT